MGTSQYVLVLLTIFVQNATCTLEVNDQEAKVFIQKVFAESKKQGINQKYSVYFDKALNALVYESEDFENRQKRQVSSSENTNPSPNPGNHDEVQLVQNPIEAIRNRTTQSSKSETEEITTVLFEYETTEVPEAPQNSITEKNSGNSGTNVQTIHMAPGRNNEGIIRSKEITVGEGNHTISQNDTAINVQSQGGWG